MTLFRCAACGHILFPARLLCPRCGEDAWEAVTYGSGRVEAATTLSQNAYLAAVRIEGVTVLARMDTTPAPGDTVALNERADGAVMARPMENCDA